MLLEQSKHGNNYSPTSKSYHLEKMVPYEKLYKQVNMSVTEVQQQVLNRCPNRCRAEKQEI